MARSPKHRSRRNRSRSHSREKHRRRRTPSKERRYYEDRDRRRRRSRTTSSERKRKTQKKEEDMIKQKEKRKLDQEMKKRRERVEKWRDERKRRQAAINSLSTASQVYTSSSRHKGKKWNLEDDDDDDVEEEEDIQIMKNGQQVHEVDDEIEDNEHILKQEIDPLDDFMVSIKDEVKKIKQADKIKLHNLGLATTTSSRLSENYEISQKSKPVPPDQKTAGRGELVEQGQDLQEYSSEEEELSYHEMLAAMNSNQSKLDKFISAMDKTYFEYPAFEKNFYKEVPEISNMSLQDVAKYREELGDVQIRGKNCPKPIKSWAQAGLSIKILDMLKRQNFTVPTPIQSQALPVIMSGRDVIAIAKTGSGKTLAFLLPLFRHLSHQELPGDEDGPIALIMTPTRELATQIYRDTKRFMLRIGTIGDVACVYGGAGIADQIAALKRRPSVVVATPGRMIDMLASNSGKITNLKRITYCVLDEADRMFDMGFEPQVMRILELMRPDKQTVLFSATFPRQMEALARRILKKPIEIQIGGRSVVTDMIEQHIILLSGDDTKYLKLLEILGHFYGCNSNFITAMALNLRQMQETPAAPPGSIASMLKTKSAAQEESEKSVNFTLIGSNNMQLALIPKADFSRDETKILIFVEKQERADDLLKELINSGYPCLSLHGGIDQYDRDSVISDFKAGNVKILVATSVAARGLDVKNLDVVVNFDCPNHYEDYVHRCGRAGRAGKKGFSYTFLTQQQGRMAGELIKALELSNSLVPQELRKLWASFKEEKKAEGVIIKDVVEPGGTATGFKSGRGFKFDKTEDVIAKENKKSIEKSALSLPQSDEEDNAMSSQIDSKLDRILKGESDGSSLLVPLKGPSLSTSNVINVAVAASALADDPVIAAKLDAARKVAAKIMTVGGAGFDFMQKQTEAFLKGKVPDEPEGYEKRLTMAENMAEKLNAKLKYNPDDAENINIKITGSSIDSSSHMHLSTYDEEVEINDLPQQCRWRICSRETVNYISEYADVSIAVKGQYIAPVIKKGKGKDKVSIPGTSASIELKAPRKLYLHIESTTPFGVQMAKAEIKRVIKEELVKLQANAHQNKGRYVLF